jgi:hypothetical protein
VVHGIGALNTNDQLCEMMNSDAGLNEFRGNVRWGFSGERNRGDKRLVIRVRVHGSGHALGENGTEGDCLAALDVRLRSRDRFGLLKVGNEFDTSRVVGPAGVMERDACGGIVGWCLSA